MATVKHPQFRRDIVIAIADALGDTDVGLSGSEIGRALAHTGIPDPVPTMTKRHRLATALQQKQARDQAGNCIIAFITTAMGVGNYVRRPARFEELRELLDPALALAGLRVRDDGRVGKSKAAETLDEVQALTGRLLRELQRRNVHEEVIRYCQEELIRRSTFHAVSEATKGLASRLRLMTGATTDGAELIDEVFSTRERRPMVRINDFETKSEASEHVGFSTMMKGVMGTFRNPTAHATRTEWEVREDDALDLFSTLSYLHRRLDTARVRRRE
ncbi:TIGR02391 family protein [Rathayibacter sp. AY1C1]|uniref:TIGR02391 family protein n=1 Tax=Rathayibacter sp. AY1C1 TaxID=2080534 RepID=UPI000CE7EB8E|nr:TIGR02391 family protein [Rathayibacter sp. AY1C1]PPH07411.1 TIGR02391 family protein [Rathayibacter sp. AY1C1]